jgi:CO/xanthine dehydrogenase Mo-binding subunit/aerobic-type carbon monoxide dehydrogenase small subunit (CoxS/CutS family)
MPEQIAIEMTVNGQNIHTQADADKSLLDFLREDLGLTGVKKGCGTGHCGTCTVILNGRARRSCTLKLARANHGTVETIEGLSKDGLLHPLQRTFIKYGAVQCGFCTPGMIMSAKALLDANPNPTQDEIKKALSHNICRCTGYVNIFKAIQAAAKIMLEGTTHCPPPEPEEKVQSTLRIQDALERVSGQTQYAADQRLEKMLHGKILWTAHPRAEILSIDSSTAENMPGVTLVLTAKDVPGANFIGKGADQPVLAVDRVNFIGDPVAVVFAETLEAAKAAAGAIQVEYKPLPGVFDMGIESPVIREGGNLARHAHLERGNPEKVWKDCNLVLEEDFSTPIIAQGFLEPESGIGYPAEDGGVVVEMASQDAFYDQRHLCAALNMPPEKVRIIQPPMGGSFGGKDGITFQPLLALGALRTQRPVQIVLERAESLRVHVKRHPTHMHYKLGLNAEGQILALQTELHIDTGPYKTQGPDVIKTMTAFSSGPYFIPCFKLDGWCWYSNNNPGGAMRGFGTNQVAAAAEQMMDEAARRLNIDPFEIRLRNALRPGLPTTTDQVLDASLATLSQTLETAREALTKLDLPQSQGDMRIGVGIASGTKGVGIGNAVKEVEEAAVELDANGLFTIIASQHELGQGALPGLSQIAANELGIPVSQIRVTLPDTAYTPPSTGTRACKMTFLAGAALVKACQQLKDNLFGRAAELLDVDPAELRLAGASIHHPASQRSLPLSTLGERFYCKQHFDPGLTVGFPPDGISRYGQPGFQSRRTLWCYTFNTQAAVVAVNIKSGQVQVLQIISVTDIGKVLNPTVVAGQVHGGTMQGLGYALSEQYQMQDGWNLTDNFGKIGLPKSTDTPQITPIFLEIPHPLGPQGAKGFSEAVTVPTAPAILNAIRDAAGVRICHLPATRKKVREALNRVQ